MNKVRSRTLYWRALRDLPERPTLAGRFYQTDSSQQMVMACDNDPRYSLWAPESGAMMATASPIPRAPS